MEARRVLKSLFGKQLTALGHYWNIYGKRTDSRRRRIRGIAAGDEEFDIFFSSAIDYQLNTQ